MKKFRALIGIAILLITALACGVSSAGNSPLPENAGIETVVAATFSAMTQSAAPGTIASPQPSSNLLPRSLYFLNNDAAGIAQVFRLETDGKTMKQLTAETAKVESFDVSLVDGSVVFVSNNQLFTVNVDGSNRSMIFDGGTVDANNPFVNTVRFPVWSPNGQTIAFGYKGLNFYSIDSGQSNLILPDNVRDGGNGFLFPEEMIWPDKYSPDGSKLIVTLGYYEGASAAIYYPNSGSLVRLSNDQGAPICCGDTHWNADASSFFSASPTFGMFSAGLWRVNAATGAVTTLISGTFDSNPINLADEPFPAPDGSLYYFFGSQPGGTDMLPRPPLQLVHSDADGVTNRTVIRPETFDRVNEALWAPDASFVIVANAEIPENYQGGKLELYYTDGITPVISLIPYGMSLKWGP
jgi:Tol biopolymer transport system component